MHAYVLWYAGLLEEAATNARRLGLSMQVPQTWPRADVFMALGNMIAPGSICSCNQAPNIEKAGESKFFFARASRMKHFRN